LNQGQREVYTVKLEKLGRRSTTHFVG